MVRCDVPVIPPTAVTITITITITSKDDVWCGNRLKIHSWLLEILSHLTSTRPTREGWQGWAGTSGGSGGRQSEKFIKSFAII